MGNYAGWLDLDKTSGSGNGVVNAAANTVNTGRNARQTTITFKAVNCSDVPRTVLQKGTLENVNIQSQASSASEGQTLTLTGKSNSAKLTFSLGTGDLVLTIPSSYKVNGVNTSNGASIGGDPGATSEYDFSIEFSVAANPGTSEKSRQVIVTDAAGNTSMCTITLAAGEAYLRVSPETIELDADGTAKSFTVESNTNWVVE